MFSWLLSLVLSMLLAPANAAPQGYVPPPQARASLPVAAAKPVPFPVRKDENRLGVDTQSKAVAVVDWRSGILLFGKNDGQPQPIASITKLMTALAVLDTGLDQAKTVQVLDADTRPGGVPYVAPGDTVTVSDLMHVSLIASGNNAAAALARATGLSESEFASRMNSLAARIGMTDSRFVEPTGLDPANVSSARDVAALIRAALSSEIIRDIVTQPSFTYTTAEGRRRTVRSTDELLGTFLAKPPYAFLGGKTGYIEEAGYCFAAAAQDGAGDRIIAVVLGAPSFETRFSEVKSLLFWAFDAFKWPVE